VTVRQIRIKSFSGSRTPSVIFRSDDCANHIFPPCLAALIKRVLLCPLLSKTFWHTCGIFREYERRTKYIVASCAFPSPVQVLNSRRDVEMEPCDGGGCEGLDTTDRLFGWLHPPGGVCGNSKRMQPPRLEEESWDEPGRKRKLGCCFFCGGFAGHQFIPSTLRTEVHLRIRTARLIVADRGRRSQESQDEPKVRRCKSNLANRPSFSVTGLASVRVGGCLLLLTVCAREFVHLPSSGPPLFTNTFATLLFPPFPPVVRSDYHSF
jgi:hypothetical protein